MTLGVNALTAREMLTRFLSAHRSKSDAADGLKAIFCVAGQSADPATGNAQIRLRLVRESRIEEIKKTLTKVLGVYVYR